MNTNMGKDIPQSIRIRTGDDNEYRFHAVETAADFYDCNRSDAVAYACDNVPQLAAGVQEVLRRDDLTPKQKREMAETLSGRGLEFTVDETVTVEK